MESMDFKLPFSTLQDLAVFEIAHSLMVMDLKVSRDSLEEESLRESLSKVDKLEILDKQKCHIREVLKGTFDHLQNWFTSCTWVRYICFGGKMKLQFDVYGCVDEVRMVRDFWQKDHSDERWSTDLLIMKCLLSLASHYVLLPDIQKILPEILKLRAVDSAVPQLEGLEFQVDTEENLCLVYRFVDQQGMPVLNVDYFEYLPMFNEFRVSNSCVRITLHDLFYNLELFRVHWNLLEESKRMPFVRKLIIKMSSANLNRQVVDIFHFLDPDSRRGISDGIHSQLYFIILRSLLVWPYQEIFLRVLQLVMSLRKLHHYHLIELFEVIVSKLNMMAFKEVLCPFWKAICSELKSTYSRYSLDERFKAVLKKLSQKNVPMYKRVSADLNLPLTHLRESRKRKHDDSLSSGSNV